MKQESVHDDSKKDWDQFREGEAEITHRVSSNYTNETFDGSPDSGLWNMTFETILQF